MAKTGIAISGADEMRKLLKGLPKRLQNRVMTKAVRAGSGEIRKALKSAVPSVKKFTTSNGFTFSSSQLKKEISNKVRKGKGGDKYAVIITKDGFPWHWLEYGTLGYRKKPLSKARSAKAQELAEKGSGGKRMGVKKIPFARAAFAGARGKAFQVTVSKLVEEIPKEIAKVVKRGKL